jgi:hypothetical protein
LRSPLTFSIPFCDVKPVGVKVPVNVPRTLPAASVIVWLICAG